MSETNMNQEQDYLPENRQPYEPAYYSAVPTGFTKHLRTNPLWQAWRFVVINIKMVRMISRSHANE